MFGSRNKVSGDSWTWNGWKCMPYSTSDLKAGDICWNRGHTEIYLGNGKWVGARNNNDGKPGDSDGQEITVGSRIMDYLFTARYVG